MRRRHCSGQRERAGGPEAGDGWSVADCEEALAELSRAESRAGGQLIGRRPPRADRRGRVAGVRRSRRVCRCTGLARLCRRAGRTEEAGELERRAAEWGEPPHRRAEALPWDV